MNHIIFPEFTRIFAFIHDNMVAILQFFEF